MSEEKKYAENDEAFPSDYRKLVKDYREAHMQASELHKGLAESTCILDPHATDNENKRALHAFLSKLHKEIETMMEVLGETPNIEIDIDTILTPTARSLRASMEKLLSLLGNEDVKESEFIPKLIEELGKPEPEVKHLIERLVRDGVIYYSKEGYLRKFMM